MITQEEEDAYVKWLRGNLGAFFTDKYSDSQLIDMHRSAYIVWCSACEYKNGNGTK